MSTHQLPWEENELLIKGVIASLAPPAIGAPPRGAKSTSLQSARRVDTSEPRGHQPCIPSPTGHWLLIRSASRDQHSKFCFSEYQPPTRYMHGAPPGMWPRRPTSSAEQAWKVMFPRVDMPPPFVSGSAFLPANTPGSCTSPVACQIASDQPAPLHPRRQGTQRHP